MKSSEEVFKEFKAGKYFRILSKHFLICRIQSV